jgi:hypothetical protein
MYENHDTMGATSELQHLPLHWPRQPEDKHFSTRLQVVAITVDNVCRQCLTHVCKWYPYIPVILQKVVSNLQSLTFITVNAIFTIPLSLTYSYYCHHRQYGKISNPKIYSAYPCYKQDIHVPKSSFLYTSTM